MTPELNTSARFRDIARKSAERASPSFQSIVRGGMNAGPSFGNPPNRTLYQRYEQYGMFQSNTFSAGRLVANRMARPVIQVALVAPSGQKWKRGLQEKSRHLPQSMRRKAAQLRPLDDHPIIDALDDPNPFMLAYQLKLVTFMGLEIFGDYYWWMERIEKPDGAYKYRIWPVPPHWLYESYNRDGSINGRKWNIRPPGVFEGIDVPAESVVMFRYPDPFDPFGVLSTIQALARPISIDAAGELAIEAQMRNSANPGLAIITGRPQEFLGITGIGEQQVALNAGQRDELMSWFRERYQGFTRAGEPLILDGLIKDVKQLNSLLNSMDNSTMAAYNEGKIYKGFAVNRISMGDVEAANRATASVADEHLVVNALEPRTTMLNQTLTKYMGRYMADERGPVEVYQEVSIIRDEDLDLRRQTEMLDRGVMSRNEVRAEQGRPPIQGGDEIFLHDSNQGGGGQWIPVRVRDDEEPTGDIQFPDQQLDGGGRQPSGKKGSRPRLRPSEIAWTTFPKPSESEWHNMLKARADRSEALRRTVEKGLRKTLKAWLRDKFAFARQVLRNAKRTDTAQTLVNRAWPVDRLAKELSDHVQEAVESASQAAVEFEWQYYRDSKSAELRVKEASVDSLILAKLVGGTKDAAKKIANEIGRVANRVWNWLRRQFKRIEPEMEKERQQDQAQQPNDPTATQKAAVKIADEAVTPAEADDRANQKSGDGATTIVNEGRSRVVEVLAKAGRVVEEVWKTRRDARVRDSHQDAEGQRKPPGQKFQVGGHYCDYPGDYALPAGERINCRCTSVAVYR